MRKYSRQREAIRTYLKGRTDHPTAEQIYRGVRTELPGISRGTVYRNLNVLTADGELLRLVCADGVEHFDPNPRPHVHFHCTGCNAVLDAQSPAGFTAELPFDLDCGRAESYTLIFSGLCRSCREKAGGGLDNPAEIQ